MTHHTKTRLARTKILALVIGAACVMPAVAQTSGSGTSGTSGTTGPSVSTTTTERRDTRDFDWGWLGLLGLAGLLGMRRQPHVSDDLNRTRTTSTTSR